MSCLPYQGAFHHGTRASLRRQNARRLRAPSAPKEEEAPTSDRATALSVRRPPIVIALFPADPRLSTERRGPTGRRRRGLAPRKTKASPTWGRSAPRSGYLALMGEASARRDGPPIDWGEPSAPSGEPCSPWGRP